MSGMPIPPAGPAAATIGPGSAPAATAEEEKLAHDFEAVFLSQFVDQMMKTVDVSASGGGEGAEMWRSFMSEAMAERLADQGGLGIGTSIKQMLAAYRR